MTIKDKNYVKGWVSTAGGQTPKVTTELDIHDRLGSLSARATINRKNYKVEPGLYAIGAPDGESPVLVSANYKLSFDALRKELTGINAWILVIDTKGINVWCAAGKGTFGTGEIVFRISDVGLENIVSGRTIIIPQLGAPGVSAHEVKKHTGFSVVYGPVRASDIRAYLNNGLKASKDMREVKFTFSDRAVLAPAELMMGVRHVVILSVIFFWLSGPDKGIFSIFNFLLAFLAGTVLAPLLLPWLPGTSFSVKGVYAGLIAFIIAEACGFTGKEAMIVSAWALMMVSVSSFITMNFTGSSTYTSLSGVLKEMKIAVPLQLVGFITGVTLFLIYRFT